MGSWSESCGFSGIEIGEGEVAYVAFLGQPKYSDQFGPESCFALKTPFIRGTYNDYGYLHVEDDEGIIALFNKLSGLELKNGDDFADRDEHFVEGLHRYWVRGDVLDAVGMLRPDFPHYWPRAKGSVSKSVNFKTIAEGVKLRLDDVRAGVSAAAEAKAKWDRLKESGDSLTPEERSEILGIFGDIRLTEVFGYVEPGLGWQKVFEEAIAAGDIEPAMEAYRRDYQLGYAGAELRKKYVPSERGGPQHGGEDASNGFARAILKIQRERKKRWDD